MTRQRLVPIAVVAAALVVALALIGGALWLTGGFGGGKAGDGATAPAPAVPPPGPRHGGPYRVCAWSRGDQDSLIAATAAGAVDEVDFDWYRSLPDGGVEADSENVALVSAVQQQGIATLATITNYSTQKRSFDPALAHKILHSPELQDRQATEMIALCDARGYAGIDLDWEALRAADRDRFSAFVETLAARLHDEDLILSMAAAPKFFEPGRWDSQKAQDYARLGAAVDEFKIMTYAVNGPWSGPGPQMPLSWADMVLTFAESVMPPEKVYLGVPFYGFDWGGGSTTAVHATDVSALRHAYKNQRTRDASSREAVIHYTDDAGADHTVYYMDRKALQAKLAWLRTQHPRIAGIAIWEAKDEDPRFWDVIVAELGGSAGGN